MRREPNKDTEEFTAARIRWRSTGMRVVFRADASVSQGSGHLMRCLTLAEEFDSRGDEVVFLGAIDSIPWLDDHLARAGYPVVVVEPDALPLEAVLDCEPDWVVVDSYRIDAGAIGRLSDRVPVLAVVDGDARGIEARLYLDQNLGALAVPGHEGGSLAGAQYALIRNAVLDARRDSPWFIPGVPRLTAFMGGTDPGGVIARVAGELAAMDVHLDITVVAPVVHHEAVAAALPGATLLAPTTDLPAILAQSDLVVSAAGTSAWDICALGVPALLVGVVDNQSSSLAQAVAHGLALGIDLTLGDDLARLPGEVARLATDRALRESLSRASTAAFDGLGKRRVRDAVVAATADRL